MSYSNYPKMLSQRENQKYKNGLISVPPREFNAGSYRGEFKAIQLKNIPGEDSRFSTLPYSTTLVQQPEYKSMSLLMVRLEDYYMIRLGKCDGNHLNKIFKAEQAKKFNGKLLRPGAHNVSRPIFPTSSDMRPAWTPNPNNLPYNNASNNTYPQQQQNPFAPAGQQPKLNLFAPQGPQQQSTQPPWQQGQQQIPPWQQGQYQNPYASQQLSQSQNVYPQQQGQQAQNLFPWQQNPQQQQNIFNQQNIQQQQQNPFQQYNPLMQSQQQNPFQPQQQNPYQQTNLFQQPNPFQPQNPLMPQQVQNIFQPKQQLYPQNQLPQVNIFQQNPLNANQFQQNPLIQNPVQNNLLAPYMLNSNKNLFNASQWAQQQQSMTQAEKVHLIYQTHLDPSTQLGFDPLYQKIVKYPQVDMLNQLYQMQVNNPSVFYDPETEKLHAELVIETYTALTNAIHWDETKQNQIQGELEVLIKLDKIEEAEEAQNKRIRKHLEYCKYQEELTLKTKKGKDFAQSNQSQVSHKPFHTASLSVSGISIRSNPEPEKFVDVIVLIKFKESNKQQQRSYCTRSKGHLKQLILSELKDEGVIHESNPNYEEFSDFKEKILSHRMTFRLKQTNTFILSIPGYHSDPKIKNIKDFKQVRDFVVYNEHGTLLWPGLCDIKYLNLNFMLSIGPTRVSMFEFKSHDLIHPEEGQKLNRPAVLKLFVRNIDQRFATIGELQEYLQQIAHENGISLGSVSNDGVTYELLIESFKGYARKFVI